MKLYIIRHGETTWNRERRMQGRCNVPLNEEGIRLANETNRGMADVPLDLVISSPLERALMTAKLVTEGRNIPILLDERLQEMSFGDWEGECILTSEKVPKDFFRQFNETPSNCIVPPNGESFGDVIARTREFFIELSENQDYQDKNILIASHGAASRCLLCQFYEDQENIWRGCIPKNCAVTIVEVQNGEGRVLELDHLFYETK